MLAGRASTVIRKLVLLVVINLMIVTAQGANCNAGQHLVSEHCCKSTYCPRDHQFHLCSHDGGSDTCTPCPSGKINADEIYTEQWDEFLDVCHIPDCDCLPGAIITDHNKCLKTGEKYCECNREKWYYGEDPKNCILADATLKIQVMEDGIELQQNGTVRQCQPGYFKPQKNGSICYPHSKCPEGYSVDVSGTNITDTICKKISTPFQKDERNLTSSQPTTSTSVPNLKNTEKNDNGSKLSVYLAVGIVVLVLIGLIAGCWLVQKRNTKASLNRSGLKITMETQSPHFGEQSMKNTGPSCYTCADTDTNLRRKDSLDDITFPSHMDFDSLLSTKQGKTTESIDDAYKSDLDNIPMGQD